MRTFNHLTWNNRLQIEAYKKAGWKPDAIAREIGVHISTIYRELKRGDYEHLNTDYTTEMRYSPEKAEKKYRDNLSAKGAPLKIGSDIKLANHIEERIIKKKYSPAATLGEIKQKGLAFTVTICVATLYSYIDKGIFLNLTNKDLPVKTDKKRPYNTVKQARAPKGKSIEQRPAIIGERTTFGNWEMDTVEGKKGVTKSRLLVLTERLARQEIIIKMKDGTAESVVKSLDLLEYRYGEMFKTLFKTITVDNGSEFADCAGMERSRDGVSKRTTVYYCHPYSSCERGSNENQNKMIRRHLPKGYDFDGVPEERISEIETWINDYPRGIFDFSTASSVFFSANRDVFGRRKINLIFFRIYS